MKLSAVLRAYGFWLAGVLTAAGAAYFLYRSRLVSLELEDELAGSEHSSEAGMPAVFEDY